MKDKDKEIEILNNDIKILLKENNNKEKVILKYRDIINQLETEANKNIQVCNNRGFNFISSTDEVKILDDFEFNEYIGYLVSLEILDKLNELKSDDNK